VVEEKLVLWWSPLQISRWLMEAYSGDEEMRVSHETIYQALFIQGNGALRKDPRRHHGPGVAAFNDDAAT
jgi:IS30 family transposase